MTVLRKTCLKDWPIAGIWAIVFQEGSHNFLIRLEWFYAETVCANNKVYTEHMLYFWECGILLHGEQKFFMWVPVNIHPGNESLMNFSGRYHYVCFLNPSMNEWSTFCVIPCKRTQESCILVLGFLRTSPRMHFSLLGFVLCSFTVIDHSHKHNSILCPMIPLVNHQTCG